MNRKRKMEADLDSNMQKFRTTYTITFGDQAENHVGMQKIGNAIERGYSIEELKEMMNHFQKKGNVCEFVDLKASVQHLDAKIDEAGILIIRNGVKTLIGEDNCVDDVFNELSELEFDKKAKMYGRVVNKHARHNLCFADGMSQEPDYEAGKGSC